MKASAGTLFALFALLAWATAHGAAMFDPALASRSIKSEHFRIHYHRGLEAEDSAMAARAEEHAR